ncbi:hypothetical protein [Marinactinospora rubrisoli]|uniref:Secreted protein n=1 Tax=Marinactinospora rubrisoli TaxID=2715399 RepID=A0ABW2KEU9_9ACTN
MSTCTRVAATAATAAALLGGGIAVAGPATAAQWDGPVSAYTNVGNPAIGYQTCETTGQIGVHNGAYQAYRCDFDGWFTTYLYVIWA